MKSSELDYLVLTGIDDKISTLLKQIKINSADLILADISSFIIELEDIYQNDFQPILKQFEQNAESAAPTAFSDKYDYLSRT